MVIAVKYLTDNPVGHPDYEWMVNGWSERSDIWIFPFRIRCKKPIPKEDQEKFAGAPAFSVSKIDGSVRIIGWAEYNNLSRDQPHVASNKALEADAKKLADSVAAVLECLRSRGVHTWDNAFDRPLKELREWHNYRAAVALLKADVRIGGMGGLLDLDLGFDKKGQAEFVLRCEDFDLALRRLDERIAGIVP